MTGLLAGLLATLAFACPATAQEGAPEPPPDAAPAVEGAPAPRKPKPRPKPRPTPKVESKIEPKVEARPAAEAGRASPEAPPVAGASLEPVAHPATPAPTPLSAPPSATPFASPVVACDPGRSVRYGEGEGTGAAAGLWVTRTGSVSVDNPLRPLTPDVTRVLQVVVGAKLATAYGPDLTALRRGPTPGALEGVLGGPIRWDATLGTLPETLSLVSDAGKPLAEMRFHECGEAPAVKAAPVARRPKTEPGPSKAAERRRPAPKPAATPPGFNLPQGALR